MIQRGPNFAHREPGLWASIKKNPISTFAVICVACTAAFLGYMTVWQTHILSSPTWCAKAMGAEKMLPGQGALQTLEALRSCNNLLMVQVSAIAIDSHINQGAFALVLVVLIVVVIAGAKASFSASKGGISGSVSKAGDDLPEQKVAAAAAEQADQITDERIEGEGHAGGIEGRD